MVISWPALKLAPSGDYHVHPAADLRGNCRPFHTPFRTFGLQASFTSRREYLPLPYYGLREKPGGNPFPLRRLFLLYAVWLATKPTTDPTNSPTQNVERRTGNNPLGEHPSIGKANNLIAASIIGHAAIAYILPPAWRQGWQYVRIGVKAGAVYHNRSVGLKMDLGVSARKRA
jgi:hypothetical protein